MITKAIIPAAGRGTRVAALRGATPKECLEVAGLPMIGFALLELALAGCPEVAIVVSPEKRALRDLVENMPPFPSAAFVRTFFPDEHVAGRNRWPRVRCFEQRDPRGVVHALAQAHAYLEDQPFALVMPDNLLPGSRAPLARLGEWHATHGQYVLGLVRITREEAARAGNCGRVVVEEEGTGASRVERLSDKRAGTFELEPGATYMLRGVGRSVVPASFAALEPDAPAEGEIDDVPRFQNLASRRELWGLPLDNRVYDLGQPAGMNAARRAFGS